MLVVLVLYCVISDLGNLVFDLGVGLGFVGVLISGRL